jgi:GDP-L-fucose synthase
MFENKKVLVLGGSGFVGTNLTKALLDKGAIVRSTSCSHSQRQKYSGVDYWNIDLTKDNLSRLFENQEYVFMCAANTSGAAVMATTPLVHVTPNVIMNALCLEAAHKAGVKKFLFISSNTVYPLSDSPLREEEANGPLFEKYFCVGSMKRFSETLCQMYSEKIKDKMITLVVRPSNIYGEYDDYEWATSHSTAALIRRVVERHEPIVVWGDGTDEKDLIYIDDFVNGLMFVMEKMDKFDPINLGSGISFSIKQTLDTILSVDGYENAKVMYDSTKPTMIPLRKLSISKIRDIGFEPQISLREGLAKTIRWYRETYK